MAPPTAHNDHRPDWHDPDDFPVPIVVLSQAQLDAWLQSHVDTGWTLFLVGLLVGMIVGFVLRWVI